MIQPIPRRGTQMYAPHRTHRREEFSRFKPPAKALRDRRRYSGAVY